MSTALQSDRGFHEQGEGQSGTGQADSCLPGYEQEAGRQVFARVRGRICRCFDKKKSRVGKGGGAVLML